MIRLEDFDPATISRLLVSPEIVAAIIAVSAFCATIGQPDAMQQADEGVVSQGRNINSEQIMREALSAKPIKLISDGKMEEALHQAHQISKEHSYDVVSQLAAGMALLRVGDKDESFLLLRRAVALAPNNKYVRLYLADQLAEAGRYDQAVSQYQLITKIYPFWGKARLSLAKLFMVTEHPEQAAEQLKVVVDSAPNDFQSRRLLAIALGRSNKSQEALEEWVTADAAERNQGGLPKDLAELKKNWGTLDRAAFELRRELRNRPDDAAAKMRLARIFMYADQVKEAKQLLMEARRHAASDPEVHRNLALALQKLGERNQALSEFMLSINLEKNREKGRN